MWIGACSAGCRVGTVYYTPSVAIKVHNIIASIHGLLPSLLSPQFFALTVPYLSSQIRELVTELVTELVKSVPHIEDALPYIVPCIMLRLGTPEITEDSEEVRLLLVDLACTIIKRVPEVGHSLRRVLSCLTHFTLTDGACE